MKFTKHILAAMLMLVCLSASAQIDLFGPPASINMGGTNMDRTFANGVFTNGAVDLHGYEGVANVDLLCFTNTAGTVTAWPLSSKDGTNWFALTNFAVANALSVNYTNTLITGGTNFYAQAANNYMLAGTWTTPTASTAGWATPYLDPTTTPFTNTAAITVSTGQRFYEIGFKVADQYRYFTVAWAGTGTATNTIVGAVFHGRRAGSIQ